jgi:hypothetical protein
MLFLGGLKLVLIIVFGWKYKQRAFVHMEDTSKIRLPYIPKIDLPLSSVTINLIRKALQKWIPIRESITTCNHSLAAAFNSNPIWAPL